MRQVVHTPLNKIKREITLREHRNITHFTTLAKKEKRFSKGLAKKTIIVQKETFFVDLSSEKGVVMGVAR